MTTAFDAYHQWLGIPPLEQPPDHYRLLGISRFESDRNVIANAADRQMTHVRTFQLGAHSVASQRLLGELAAARLCLLNPTAKTAYDIVLRSAAPTETVTYDSVPTSSTPVAVAAADQPPRFGAYQVVERLINSPLGVTYKVVHVASGGLYSLKTLPPAAAKKQEVLKRFQREIDIVTKINHPNLIGGVDAGLVGDVPFLVTQYVEGAELGELVKQAGPLAIDQAIDYLSQAAQGLMQLHDRGVFHRNLKPQVLIVDKQGRLRVTNLLLARVEDSSPLAQGEELTVMGTVLGTADYLAPEQAANARAADARSDIYSLGCTLHYLLTGQPPYQARTVPERLMAHLRLPVPSLRSARPDIPVWLDHTFQSMMAKDPQDRPPTMQAVVDMLNPPAPSLWRRLRAALGWG